VAIPTEAPSDVMTGLVSVARDDILDRTGQYVTLERESPLPIIIDVKPPDRNAAGLWQREGRHRTNILDDLLTS
jgi:hypothetical protein